MNNKFNFQKPVVSGYLFFGLMFIIAGLKTNIAMIFIGVVFIKLAFDKSKEN